MSLKRHPGSRDSEPEFDTVVIGGGIVGLCTSWFLAQEGAEVVCIDAGHQSGSIVNAGSLHVQMQSRFMRMFPDLVPAYEPTMPIYPLAVDYWREIDDGLEEYIELQINGGLVVAENQEQMDFLRYKIQRERKFGVETELIDRGELLRMAPYLSDEIIGAVFCPKEGKINPLLANAAIRRRALESGVVLHPETEVTAISREGSGYSLETTKGRFRTGRVVVAAGAGSGAIAAMLGVYLPMAAEPLHMNITEPAEPIIDHLLQHADRPITMKQLAAGQVIIGGGWPACLVGEGGHPTVKLKSIIGNLSLAQHMVPRIGDIRIIRTWAGVNPTADLRSILGPVTALPGVYFGIPGDAGYTLGPYCARLLTELIQGRDPGFDIEPFSPMRFAEDYSGAVREIS